jgi:hypothetical protein
MEFLRFKDVTDWSLVVHFAHSKIFTEDMACFDNLL